VFVELGMSESLCKNISGHLVRGTVEEFDGVGFDMLSNEVKLDIHLLCACMIFRVSGKCDCPLIVTLYLLDLSPMF